MKYKKGYIFVINRDSLWEYNMMLKKINLYFHVFLNKDNNYILVHLGTICHFPLNHSHSFTSTTNSFQIKVNQFWSMNSPAI